MRVVETDNFGGDYPDERFVTESLPLEECKKIAGEYNNRDDFASRYYKVVGDDYTLQPGFEP